MTPRQLRQSLLVIVCALLGIGIISVYSASSMVSQATYGNSTALFMHHLLAVTCGLAVALGCLMVPYGWWRRSSRWMFVLSIALLIILVVVGQKVGGARRWFRLGYWSLQPSEFAQLALVIYLAELLARRASLMHDFWRGLMPPLLATGIVAGMVVIQPDLGTAVAMGCVAMLLLIIAKARWRHIAAIVAVALAALILLVAGAEYRRERMMAFLNPWSDPQGSGYQILQSYMALASGGLFGAGVGASVQKLFYLPGAHTDFIFAIIGEEMGLVGTSAVLCLFGLFMICGFRLAILTRDLFSKYLACGLVSMIGFEVLVNVSVVTGMLPTKGLPLPFISYGGTSMVINLAACAIILKGTFQKHQDFGSRIADFAHLPFVYRGGQELRSRRDHSLKSA